MQFVRSTLQSIPITITFACLITSVTVFYWSIEPGLSTENRTYWFAIDGITTFTPSWIGAAFTHASFFHWLSNIIGIVVVGALVEQVLQRKEYILFLLTVTIVPIVSHGAYISWTPHDGVALGASGIALALIAFISTYNLASIDILNGTSIMFGAIMIVGVLFTVAHDFGIISLYEENVAEYIHLFGIMTGAVVGIWAAVVHRFFDQYQVKDPLAEWLKWLFSTD